MHIMLDLETLSLNPDAKVLSIGAVKFNSCGILDEMYANIDDKGGHVSHDTVMWWMEQSEEARSSLYASATIRGVQLQNSLYKLMEWFDGHTIWGNGASFDNVILRNLCMRYDVNPWPSYMDRCYRTWKQGKPKLTDRVGTFHNALDDAKSQANHMLEHGI